MILCLDLGTKTGWAYKRREKIYSGTENFTPKQFSSAGRRFTLFQTWLENMFVNNNFSTVFFEGVRAHKGTAAAHIYGGFVAILLTSCERKGIEFESVPVGTIKKHITGRGNASKQEMIEAVTAEIGFPPVDDNEADALALLLFVQKGL